MTNREWLERMSDQELSMFIYNNEGYPNCYICGNNGNCVFDEATDRDCLGGVIKWLKQEHDND